jgi:hypothetical protein
MVAGLTQYGPSIFVWVQRKQMVFATAPESSLPACRCRRPLPRTAATHHCPERVPLLLPRHHHRCRPGVDVLHCPSCRPRGSQRLLLSSIASPSGRLRRWPPPPPNKGTPTTGPPLTQPRGHRCRPSLPRLATSSPQGHRRPSTSTLPQTRARSQSS